MSSETQRTPTEQTLKTAAQLAIAQDKPILLDYWTMSLEKKAVIGVKEDKSDSQTGEKQEKQKLLVKSEDEYTSNIVKMYKVETDFIVITENSIYIVSSDIPARKLS